jgi:RNA polymerase-interacting CarD/CdnL/TRCF family regulator
MSTVENYTVQDVVKTLKEKHSKNPTQQKDSAKIVEEWLLNSDIQFTIQQRSDLTEALEEYHKNQLEKNSYSKI